MGTLVRALLGLLLVVALAFLALGYWTGTRVNPAHETVERPVATTGDAGVERARERGAEIGEKAAVATRKIGESVEEASLTGKIKAKMVLDDLVKARTIDVTTSGSTVTLSGTVGSTAERERALSLARETAGVSAVVDNLKVR